MIKIIILLLGMYLISHADANTSENSSSYTNHYIELIIVGISTLLFFYIRESYNNAIEKKLISIKLEAYLNNWMSDILKNEDLFSLINLGKQRYKERSLAVSDDDKWNELYDKHKEDLKKLTTTLIDEDSVQLHLKSLHSTILNMPDDIFKLSIQTMDNGLDNITKNISFISDHDASKISWYTADRIINLRNNLINVIIKTKFLYYLLKNMPEFDTNVIRDSYSSIIESIIIIGERIDPLLNTAKIIRERTTLENMLK